MKSPENRPTRFEKERTKVFQRLYRITLGILTSASIGTTTPFPTLERASAVPRCSPTTPLESPFDAFAPPQNHSTASVFLLCGSSLLSCTPAVGRLMSESHGATNGEVSLIAHRSDYPLKGLSVVRPKTGSPPSNSRPLDRSCILGAAKHMGISWRFPL